MSIEPDNLAGSLEYWIVAMGAFFQKLGNGNSLSGSIETSQRGIWRCLWKEKMTIKNSTVNNVSRYYVQQIDFEGELKFHVSPPILAEMLSLPL